MNLEEVYQTAEVQYCITTVTEHRLFYQTLTKSSAVEVGTQARTGLMEPAVSSFGTLSKVFRAMQMVQGCHGPVMKTLKVDKCPAFTSVSWKQAEL